MLFRVCTEMINLNITLFQTIFHSMFGGKCALKVELWSPAFQSHSTVTVTTDNHTAQPIQFTEKIRWRVTKQIHDRLTLAFAWWGSLPRWRKSHKMIQLPHCFNRQDHLWKHKGVHQWCNVVNEDREDKWAAPLPIPVTVGRRLRSTNGESNASVMRKSDVLALFFHSCGLPEPFAPCSKHLTPWTKNCNMLV